MTLSPAIPHWQPGSRDNVSRFDDPSLLERMNAIAAILDVDERIEATEGLQEELVNKMYYVPGVNWQLYWNMNAANVVNIEQFIYSRGGRATFGEPYLFYDPPQA